MVLSIALIDGVPDGVPDGVTGGVTDGDAKSKKLHHTPSLLRAAELIEAL